MFINDLNVYDKCSINNLFTSNNSKFGVDNGKTRTRYENSSKLKIKRLIEGQERYSGLIIIANNN